MPKCLQNKELFRGRILAKSSPGSRTYLKEISSGSFKFKTELEDIHMNIETRLIEKIGPVGGKLHTARSRNDQISLDIRMYLRDEIAILMSSWRLCSRFWSPSPTGTAPWCCPGILTFSARSPCCSATTCLPIMKCSNGTAADFAIVSAG